MSQTYDMHVTAAQPAKIERRVEERIALLLVFMALVLGFWLLYKAKTAELDAPGIVNINTCGERELHAVFQSVLPEQEISGAVSTLLARRARSRFRNIGEIRLTNGANGTPLMSAVQLARLKPRIAVREPGEYRVLFLKSTAVFFSAFLLAHVILLFRAPTAGEMFLPALAAATGIALLLQISLKDPIRDTSAYSDFAWGIFASVLISACLAAVNFERKTRFLIWLPLGAALLLGLLLLVFGRGPAGSDSHVNLEFLGWTVQPGEWIRLLLSLFLAGFLSDRSDLILNRPVPGLPRRLQGRIPHPSDIFPVVLALFVSVGLFWAMKDMGPALMIAATFAICYSIARRRFVLTTSAFIATILAIWWLMLHHPQTLGTAAGRLSMMQSPFDNHVRGGDHLAAGFWALAAGQLAGQGLGLGYPSEISNAANDFILNSIGEELGLVGLLSFMLVAALLVHFGLVSARYARSRYQFFLALTATCQLAMPMIVLGLGCAGLLPLSGVSFPFASSGLSGMLADGVLAGMVLSVSKKRDESYSSGYAWALRMVGAGFACAFMMFAGRVTWIQARAADEISLRTASTAPWKRGADPRQQVVVENPRLHRVAALLTRGTVFDRNGIPLATSDPAVITRSRAEIEAVLVNEPPFCDTVSKRIYPFSRFTSQFLGDLRFSTLHQSNMQVENALDDVLRGWTDTSELLTLLKDRNSRSSEAARNILNRKRDIYLSIDIRLQVAVSESLETFSRRRGLPRLALVIRRPENGEILASISLPAPRARSFEQVASWDEEEIFDRAQRGLYVPGSAMKIASAIALLRHDSGLEAATYACIRLPGERRVGNFVKGYSRPVRDDALDSNPHGAVQMEDAIVHSCNAWFAQAVTASVPPKEYLETLRLLGFSTAARINPGRLKHDYAWVAFGQGEISVRPVEMARLAATIANHGVTVPGTWLRTAGPVNGTAVIDGASADFIARSMREVVLRGTAASQRRNPILLSGKTGTAQLESGKSHSWFIGFAPYGGRRPLAVAAVVEHGGYGAESALPVAAMALEKAAKLGLSE